MRGDPSLENELGAAEDELIDSYLQGGLSPEDTERFQEHFLRSAARRQKVAFAERLHRHIDRHWEATPDVRSIRDSRFQEALANAKRWFSELWEGSPAPAWSYALAGLLLIALLGGTWALTDKLRLEGQLDQLTADLARLEEETASSQQELAEKQARMLELEEEIASLRERGAAATLSSAIATVWLSPGLLRDLGEVERLIIPSDAGLVRVHLDIGVDDYVSYRARLDDADGDEMWTQSKLTATSTGDKVAVSVTLPSELLPSGDYSIRLSGVSSSRDLELVGRYYFRVVEE